MAKIIKKNDDLSKEYKRYKKKTILCMVACFLVFCLIQIIGPIALVGVVGCMILFGKCGNKVGILQSGLEGEEMTADIISAFPDSFYGFQNVKITYEGKTSEIDMIVVGPTGVFIIETKNMTGTIIGDYEDQEWVHKKQVNGVTQSKKFYSPVKQVGTHVYRLANYLKDNGCSVYVASLVFFENKDADVQISGMPAQTLVLDRSTFG